MRKLGLIAVALLLGGGCGSKSGLALPSSSGNGGSGGLSSTGGGPPGGGPSGGTSGFGGSAGSVTVLPDCVYEETSKPVEVFQWSDGLRSPLLATLSGGVPNGHAQLAVAVTHGHFWHPDIRVAQVSIGPTGLHLLSVVKKMTLYGIDSHATGHLIRTKNGNLNLLYYHGDEASPSVVPGVKFRRFDTGTWKPLPETTIEDKASFAFDMVAGPGVNESGTFSGTGRFIAWRGAVFGDSIVETKVGLINENGKLLRGPVVAAGPASYGQFGAAVAWTGSNYLVATNEMLCLDDQPCSNGITVSRFLPGGGNNASLSHTAAFPADPMLRARTPQLSGLGDTAFAVWREVGEEPGTVQTLRVNVLDGSGNSIGKETTYPIQGTAGPILHTSNQGAAVLYSELGDSDGPSDAFGHTQIMLQQHAKTGQPLQTYALQTTSLTSGSPYAVAPLDHPRGLVVAWTGRSKIGEPTSALYLSFLSCKPVE